MMKREDDKVQLGFTIDGDLFEELEKARITERGLIPRNEFIRHAVVVQIERAKKGNQQYE